LDTVDTYGPYFLGVRDPELRAAAAESCRRWLRGLPKPLRDAVERWLLNPDPSSRESLRDLADLTGIPQERLIQYLEQGDREVTRDVYDVIEKRRLRSDH
jgi:hypothetical protein